jgi:[glutamine synthetase] adenylyltransferase / [glutamine synthetase]-adenylyl-L-tyrosine phosphorylase
VSGKNNKYGAKLVVGEAIERARTNSPFLSGLIKRNPDLMPMIEVGDFDAALSSTLGRTSDNTGTTLRRQRQGVALVTAIADLSHAWDLTRVTAELSDFADAALNTAIAAAIEERVPGAPNQGFTVIALGKHGGRELNYSSDIDPIFLFDPKTLPRREGEDPAESAVRIGKRVIDLLATTDENGYVFRVDMRLRPSPEVSPVALPVEAAIGYYESSALAWEQAAFIRARVCAGDRVLGEYFMRSIQSFIWRRSLDFGQLKNIRDMSAQIRDHYSRGQVLGLGYDLKRGRGGIRECEFYAQAHQLIHGGRDAGLRMADTRGALNALAEAGRIDPADAVTLSDAYTALRTVEHRLQMVNDRQTHAIPDKQDELDNIAKLHGLADGDVLLSELTVHVEHVQAIYDILAGPQTASTPRIAVEGLPLEDQLSGLGFANPADIAHRLNRWRSGKVRAIRSEAAREAFEAVLHAILAALAKAPDPERAIARFDNMIAALPSAVNFFLLLQARPALLQLVADILSYAPVLAEALGRRAELLDGLIDASAFELPNGTASHIKALNQKTDGQDYQSILDNVRAYVGEQRFSLGVQLIEGRHDPLAIARCYAHLAEAATQILAQATVAEFEITHGKVAGGELLILALGRLGGEALTHASDLDLILLFTGDYAAESDGPKPLGATQYFNRLTQRVVAALSVPTASGALYEVDTRLRPSGAKGLLCASLDSFAHYQRTEAWTWEHMALTRARPVFGSVQGRGQLQVIVDDILNMPRETERLKTDITNMRCEMATHKPPKGTLDVKAMRGGLVDIEFIIHALQLEYHNGLMPQLDQAAAKLMEAELLTPQVVEAQNLLSRLLVILRLVAPDCEPPPEPAQALIARCLDLPDWSSVIAAIDSAHDDVVKAWHNLFGKDDSFSGEKND